jgi:hypothetical protein
MRLAAITYSTDHEFYTGLAVMHLRDTVDPELTEIIVVDNGSGTPFRSLGDRDVRYEENIGGNAVFHRWITDDWWKGDQVPDYLAFLHCDLMVRERHWDQRVIDAFDADPKLDLIGFVGSNQIDARGGRGAGTMLNFIGGFYEGVGVASSAGDHGRKIRTLEPAAVVDHCAMIFRRSTLEQLTPQEGNYAPEHFYDRLLSCEILKRKGRIAVLGVESDHFSGGIGPGMPKADALRQKWLTAEGIPFDPQDTYTAIYLEAERRFFAKYEGFFPLHVTRDYEVVAG